MSGLFVGIDPGLSGAVAMFTPKGAGGAPFLEVHDMPVFDQQVGRNVRKRLDVVSLLGILGVHGSDRVEAVFLEAVGPTPHDSRAGAFAFGEVYGATRACVFAHRLRLEQVTPQRWKKHFGLLRTGKDESRARAIELFPDHRALFARRRDDGRADAALIALFASRLWKGGDHE